MADRKANPAVVRMRKEIELSEKKVFLQRQILRQAELEDEKTSLVDAIRLTQDQISALEKEVDELKNF